MKIKTKKIKAETPARQFSETNNTRRQYEIVKVIASRPKRFQTINVRMSSTALSLSNFPVNFPENFPMQQP
jgi:hypothetical protein